MTGQKDNARGNRRGLHTFADALPGQSLTVFLALIAAGAIALGATAFGGWPGSSSAAHAADLGINDPAARTNLGNYAAVPAAESSEGTGPVRDTTGDSPTDPVVTSASPEPLPPNPDLTTARSVPLTEADKQLLIKVRQAGLWEIPTGEQAQQKAESPIVKAVGRQLAADHRKLDDSVRKLAADLDVVLPSTPSALQQGWMKELSAANGAEYDRLFADRLRAAHGTVFNIIAQVRTGTRNPIIRAYAQTANVVVMRHMTLLESTGLVAFNDLPAPVLSQASSTGSGSGDSTSPGIRTVLIVAMLAAAALIGTVSIRRVRRGA
jgi:predicted outer membrane protein